MVNIIFSFSFYPNLRTLKKRIKNIFSSDEPVLKAGYKICSLSEN